MAAKKTTTKRAGGARKTSARKTATRPKPDRDPECIECDEGNERVTLCGEDPDCDDVDVLRPRWTFLGCYNGPVPVELSVRKKGTKFLIKLRPVSKCK